MIKSRRTIRRFKQKRIDYNLLSQIVDAGRLAPSASNLQPLEFIILDDKKLVAQVMPFTAWAGYLPDDAGRPPKGKQPVAFIVILINRTIRKEGGGEDVGAAIENMILTALDEGIGACWIGSVNRDKVRSLLSIPETYDLASILALGFPDERPIIENVSDSIEYYKDGNDCLHVPKRALKSILHRNKF